MILKWWLRFPINRCAAGETAFLKSIPNLVSTRYWTSRLQYIDQYAGWFYIWLSSNPLIQIVAHHYAFGEIGVPKSTPKLAPKWAPASLIQFLNHAARWLYIPLSIDTLAKLSEIWRSSSYIVDTGIYTQTGSPISAGVAGPIPELCCKMIVCTTLSWYPLAKLSEIWRIPSYIDNYGIYTQSEGADVAVPIP